MRVTSISKSSPVGTAELSPGRSPGLPCTIEKSRRDDWNSYRDMVLNSRSESGILNRGINFEIQALWDRLRVTSSRPYGTLRLSNLYRGLRPICANLFRMFFVKIPKNRHPERSASRIYRVTQRLWRGVEGPRRCLSYPCCSDFFDHRSPHRADPPRSFP
jgi:hypothetical protein